MPELAEIRIMAKMIDTIGSVRRAVALEKSSISKNLDPSGIQVNQGFTAVTRGKELKIRFFDSREICFMMGMSGNWVHAKEWPKHAHFRILLNDGMSLFLVDQRRFAKWRFGSFGDRGPCPVLQHNAFVENVTKSLDHKAFDKPIHEVLLDQRYFNGIGNYLRSTILYYADVNPFMNARKVLRANNRVLSLCKEIPLRAEQLGGGQFKDWKNPFNVDPSDFLDWVFYKKGSHIKDATGRTFWFNPKYRRR